MSWLAAPLTVAALVLCVAGLAKLRAPDGAAAALGELGLPSSRGLVRLAALAELGLGIAVAVRPLAAPEVALAVLYGAFAAITLRLAALRAACGCFGEHDRPASGIQAALSLALALLAGMAAVAGAPGVQALAEASLPVAAATLIGVGGAVYALVLAYVELPAAWAAWGPR